MTQDSDFFNPSRRWSNLQTVNIRESNGDPNQNTQTKNQQKEIDKLSLHCYQISLSHKPYPNQTTSEILKQTQKKESGKIKDMSRIQNPKQEAGLGMKETHPDERCGFLESCHWSE